MRPVALFSGSNGYADAVMALSPVGYWPLGEKAGTVAADLMGKNNGTYVNSPTLGAAGPLVGDPATGVTLSGTGQYVTGPNVAALHPGDTLSLAVWAKRSATQGAAQRLLDGGSGDYSLTFNASNGVSFGKSAIGDMFISAATVTDTAWHLLVATKKANAVSVYLDGVAMAKGGGTDQTLVAASDLVYMGARFNATQLFPGSIAHVAIWNRALSAAEVKALYDIGMGR